MNYYKIFISSVLLSTITACAIGPMLAPNSGRSLGKGKVSLEGSVLPTLAVNLGYGITENLDAGVLVEQQFGPVGALWSKYSFLNQQGGWSIAGYGGVHAGKAFVSSSGFFAGPVISYRHPGIEPYVSLRFTRVKWDASELSLSEQDDAWVELTTWDDIYFSYIQTDIGVNFWPSEKVGINLHGKIFTFLDDEISSSGTVVPGFSFIFLF